MGKIIEKIGFVKHKCKFCARSFSQAGNLKRHIHTAHEGHKDHKCESFSKRGTLKTQIYTVHKKHKGDILGQNQFP